MYNIFNTLVGCPMRLQEFGYTIRKARLARWLTQAELAHASRLSRTTMNQLENGLFPDLGVRKAQAILEVLGLDLHIRPAQRLRRPDFVRMALVEASASYREKLGEGELVRTLLTGRIAPRRRPHIRTLLEEAPASVLRGMVEDIGKYVEQERIDRNLRVIAESLGALRRVTACLGRK